MHGFVNKVYFIHINNETTSNLYIRSLLVLIGGSLNKFRVASATFDVECGY